MKFGGILKAAHMVMVLTALILLNAAGLEPGPGTSAKPGSRLQEFGRCLAPEVFSARIHIDKEQSFAFHYKGTVMFLPSLDPSKKLLPDEYERVISELVAELAKDSSVTEVKPMANGRMSVNMTRRGRVRDQTQEMLGGFKMEVRNDQSVWVTGPRPVPDAICKDTGYQMDGSIRFTTASVVVDHNGELPQGADGYLLTPAEPKKDEVVLGTILWNRDDLAAQPFVRTAKFVPFTSNVSYYDPAIDFALKYLHARSVWEGDTFTWQIRYFSAGGFDGIGAHAAIDQLKEIHLRVTRKPLSKADQLNGVLDSFRIDVHASVWRDRELRGETVWSKWSDMPEYYSPFVMVVEHTNGGYSVKGHRMGLTGDLNMFAAISPVLDRVDRELVTAEWPERLSLDNISNLKAGASKQPARNQPSSSQAIVSGEDSAYQATRIARFLALHHQRNSLGEHLDFYAPGHTHNGQPRVIAQVRAEEESYRNTWTHVVEFPFNIQIRPLGGEAYQASYTMVHRAESSPKKK